MSGQSICRLPAVARRPSAIRRFTAPADEREGHIGHFGRTGHRIEDRTIFGFESVYNLRKREGDGH